MKTARFLPVLLPVALAFTAASPAGAASSHKSVAFKAKYAGTASVLISDSTVKILSVAGNGSASVVGSGSVAATGNGVGVNGQCVPFKGTGTIKGAKGTIKFSVSNAKSQGCSSGQSGPVTVTVDGVAKVTGGTGGAKGAKGNLKFKGELKLSDTSGSQSGAFTGTLSGKLTLGK